MEMNTLYGSTFAERFGSTEKGCLTSLDKGCLLDGLEKGCIGLSQVGEERRRGGELLVKTCFQVLRWSMHDSEETTTTS